uniref:C2H2-type domain-containing protein n=1 Tax=Brassica campestris TaxID=3711 RepID=A0A3P6A747_BRACM|nr:unnamed protein product [Brassica rapa]
MSGNDDAETAKIEVWWDMKDCPIPEGYDARRVRPSIERAFNKRGYSTCPVSITAYGDQNQTPCHVLRGLSSTGVAVAHTKSESTRSVMYRDMVEWRGQNPPPGTMMIISDQVGGDLSWDLARLQQRTRYQLFLAYSIKPCNDLFLLYRANWRWEQLLEEEGAAPLVVGGLSSAAMFYCKSCNFDCQSLEKFRKHLSSYKHGMEEAINPPNTELSCVTETWAKNYPATPEHATAKILVLWNMNDCPIPEGYDACGVRPSIERALKEVGYTGPVSITAYADQKQTPDHHLLALSSTGVDYAHTLPSVEYSRMITDFEEWAEDNPAPASIMIISNELALRKSHSSRLCRKLQESNYKCFLAYSVRPFKMPVLLTSAEWLWESLLSGGCFLFLRSSSSTWARNYPATPKHATAKIHVLWDMKDCPIPEGYDARRVRPSIERALKEVGYTGPVSVSITAFADQKETPDHHLLALSSTDVDFAHTLWWVLHSRMITNFEEWAEDNPAPATVMIISDRLGWRMSQSSLLQKSNYNCLLAYSVRPFVKPTLLTSAEWLWESLLAVSETKRHTLQKCSGSEMVVASTGMFYCDLCDCHCKSLDDFKKHLSREEHTHEDNIMNTHFQSFRHRHRQFKMSKYHDEARYPPKTKRTRKTDE